MTAWKKLHAFFAALALTCLLTGANSAAAEDDMLIKMELVYGDVLIKLFPEKAPGHVDRITTLAKEGFYDGVVFHRVIPGFMAQTGDPTGTGTGGSDYPDLKAEFNDTPHRRGIVSMARAASPNSANSQFFIVFDDAPHLDGQYTAFGEVIEGMEHVDKIKKGGQFNNGKVKDPDNIVKMTVVSE